MTIDLDKLDAVAAGGHSHLLQCIEGYADGYVGSADEIDASHAEHFAKDLVESIEWEDETLCLVEARALSAVVAELREARAAIERVREVGDELAAAPMVGSSSEEQWELDAQRGCGRSILEALDGAP
ncbi:hypothetical protein GS982_13005 [Rhodococcus hoagii]|uniref:Uncharacterized protein n=1 Tax=Rhodococcus hoagii TaxID=43767 RepID=A0A9Q2P8G0_RHOHA|nr:hypothetical protein [Prescottella equi]MBM4480349.1 hypothetical protein [Prescottella equi]MBM4487434.1 hypothetical protein [Prescottella equi]MBM4497128.1 hypothetical protein [Prescottella equi]MBM4497622.1 hypothetical protein [Prescottella equi]MBM4508893.1 hypothetical protein [Prescottella equi]